MVTIIRDALQDAGTNSIVNDSFENAKHVEYTEMETSELERSDYAFGLLILRSPAAQCGPWPLITVITCELAGKAKS